ncbi:c-type cytochrome biogenesis protein CcmI [Necropsobacter massiliensis]|uniref:c-type cytochrome biogenesis protein CcmI n=1 Tax=Necropsobacter massiliensis TaxID=1400001 RepID=UPI000595DC9D|nr:c-type cytochrome biogenesis protein CcmI [Necropsobacter massiliensis]
MNFWLIALLLTLLIALLCFYPLLRCSTTKHSAAKRDELNKAFYFNRLHEIENEAQLGLSDNADQLKTELQQSLLEDIPTEHADTAADKKRYGKVWFVSAFLTLVIVSALTYMQVGAWQAETMLEKTYEKLPHFYQRLKEEQTNPLNESELQQFATALRVKLQKEPDDAESWWLLGQTAMAADKAQLALDSYARANQLAPDNIEYKLAYARVLMFSDDQTDKSKGMELLKAVLRQDHTNMQALSLLAFQYFETEDYKMAAVTWAMMLRLMPKDDPRVPLIEKSIRAARDAIAEQSDKTQN